MKIIVNPEDPYSTLKPETSSDSPSAKSNGVRLVSAKHETTQYTTITGRIDTIGKSAFMLLTPLNLSLIDALKNASKISAILISYETV